MCAGGNRRTRQFAANIANVPLRAYLAGLVLLSVVGAGAAAVYGRAQAADDAREAATADARFGARLAASETGKGVEQLKATVAGAAVNPGINQAYARPKDCALAFGGTDAYTTGHIDLIRTDGSVVCSSAKTKGPTTRGRRGSRASSASRCCWRRLPIR